MSEIHSYADLNLQEMDVMKEISSIGTSHGATALSKLFQKEVRISIPEIQILTIEEAIKKLGDAEELVAATLVQMSGDIEGLMLQVFKLELANIVFDKLLGRTHESFMETDELDFSALQEIGNIIICSYINAFAKLVDVDVNLSVPSATVNMLGAIMTVPVAECGYETDRLMYINAEFIMDGKRLQNGLLMLPDMNSLNEIMEKLGVA